LTASKIIENRDSYIIIVALLAIVWFKEKDICEEAKTIGDLWFIPEFDGYQKRKQITGGSQGEV
jgi:hypothetical protein